MSQVVQLAGALTVLAAFALLQLHRVSATSPGYLAMNVLGSAALAGTAFVNEQWGFVLLNAVWCAVSAVSLGRGAAARAREPR